MAIGHNELVRVAKNRKLNKDFDEVQIGNNHDEFGKYTVLVPNWSNVYQFIFANDNGLPFGREFKSAIKQMKKCLDDIVEDQESPTHHGIKTICTLPRKVNRQYDYKNWANKIDQLRNGQNIFKCKKWTKRQEVDKLNKIFKAIFEGKAIPEIICDQITLRKGYKRNKNGKTNNVEATRNGSDAESENSDSDTVHLTPKVATAATVPKSPPPRSEPSPKAMIGFKSSPKKPRKLNATANPLHSSNGNYYGMLGPPKSTPKSSSKLNSNAKPSQYRNIGGTVDDYYGGNKEDSETDMEEADPLNKRTPPKKHRKKEKLSDSRKLAQFPSTPGYGIHDGSKNGGNSIPTKHGISTPTHKPSGNNSPKRSHSPNQHSPSNSLKYSSPTKAAYSRRTLNLPVNPQHKNNTNYNSLTSEQSVQNLHNANNGGHRIHKNDGYGSPAGSTNMNSLSKSPSANNSPKEAGYSNPTSNIHINTSHNSPKNEQKGRNLHNPNNTGHSNHNNQGYSSPAVKKNVNLIPKFFFDNNSQEKANNSNLAANIPVKSMSKSLSANNSPKKAAYSKPAENIPVNSMSKSLSANNSPKKADYSNPAENISVVSMSKSLSANNSPKKAAYSNPAENIPVNSMSKSLSANNSPKKTPYSNPAENIPVNSMSKSLSANNSPKKAAYSNPAENIPVNSMSKTLSANNSPKKTPYSNAAENSNPTANIPVNAIHQNDISHNSPNSEQKGRDLHNTSNQGYNSHKSVWYSPVVKKDTKPMYKSFSANNSPKKAAYSNSTANMHLNSIHQNNTSHKSPKNKQKGRDDHNSRNPGYNSLNNERYSSPARKKDVNSMYKSFSANVSPAKSINTVSTANSKIKAYSDPENSRAFGYSRLTRRENDMPSLSSTSSPGSSINMSTSSQPNTPGNSSPARSNNIMDPSSNSEEHQNSTSRAIPSPIKSGYSSQSKSKNSHATTRAMQKAYSNSPTESGKNKHMPSNANPSGYGSPSGNLNATTQSSSSEEMHSSKGSNSTPTKSSTSEGTYDSSEATSGEKYSTPASSVEALNRAGTRRLQCFSPLNSGTDAYCSPPSDANSSETSSSEKYSTPASSVEVLNRAGIRRLQCFSPLNSGTDAYCSPPSDANSGETNRSSSTETYSSPASSRNGYHTTNLPLSSPPFSSSAASSPDMPKNGRVHPIMPNSSSSSSLPSFETITNTTVTEEEASDNDEKYYTFPSSHDDRTSSQKPKFSPTISLKTENEELRKLNDFAARDPDLWLNDQQNTEPPNWHCARLMGAERRLCEEWKAIHRAIVRFIIFFAIKNAKAFVPTMVVDDQLLATVAVRPRLWPAHAQIDTIQTGIGTMPNLGRKPPFLNGKPAYEKRGGMALTFAMLRVKDAYKWHGTFVEDALKFTNKAMVEKVEGWANFVGNFLHTPTHVWAYHYMGTDFEVNDVPKVEEILKIARELLVPILQNSLILDGIVNDDPNFPEPPLPIVVRNTANTKQIKNSLIPKTKDKYVLYDNPLFQQTQDHKLWQTEEYPKNGGTNWTVAPNANFNGRSNDSDSENAAIGRAITSSESDQKNYQTDHNEHSDSSISAVSMKSDSEKSDDEMEEKMVKNYAEPSVNKNDQMLVQKWEEIERNLREQFEKRGAERYKKRLEIADPYDAGQLIVREHGMKRIILIPREDEIARTVYRIESRGAGSEIKEKALGKSIEQSWQNAKKCLKFATNNNKEQQENNGRQLCKMPILTNERAEAYQQWAAIGREMQRRGIPPLYERNGEIMDENELMLLLEKAFNALVNGEPKIPRIPKKVKRTETLTKYHTKIANEKRTNEQRMPEQNLIKSRAISAKFGGKVPIDYGGLKGYGERHKFPTDYYEKKENQNMGRTSELSTNSSQINAKAFNRQIPEKHHRSIAHNYFENSYKENKLKQARKIMEQEEAAELAREKKREEEERRKKKWEKSERALREEEKREEEHRRKLVEERKYREKAMQREWEKREAEQMRKHREKHIELEEKRKMQKMESEKREKDEAKLHEELRKRQKAWNVQLSSRTAEGKGAKPVNHHFGTIY
ncbi:hypothetical protein niasHT_012857 [Heterodera trifolii]|uniref:Uncharacterized protein n=1 Tax=Heterodera trifolii TaxID=157864 RepID=A0ABD2L0B7_9BILA